MLSLLPVKFGSLQEISYALWFLLNQTKCQNLFSDFVAQAFPVLAAKAHHHADRIRFLL